MRISKNKSLNDYKTVALIGEGVIRVIDCFSYIVYDLMPTLFKMTANFSVGIILQLLVSKKKKDTSVGVEIYNK